MVLKKGKLKSKIPHPSCVIYEETCICNETYIDERVKSQIVIMSKKCYLTIYVFVFVIMYITFKLKFLKYCVKSRRYDREGYTSLFFFEPVFPFIH